VTTPQAAKRLEEAFTSSYHHAFPFDSEKLLDVWSRCREQLTNTGNCQEDLKEAQQRFPLEDDEQLMKRLPSCGATQVIGQECQEGMSRVQRMLER
jgi:hypothetical protein